MSEPDPIYKVDAIKKEDGHPFICMQCGETIGKVVRVKKIRRLVKPNGEWLEGYGAVKCLYCGQLRPWIPGQEHLDRIIKRNGVDE